MNPIKHGTKVIAVSMTLLFCSTLALGQDDGPTKRQGVEYVEINYVAYKPDKRNEARAILADFFIPASEKVGTPGPKWVFHPQTGGWDAIFIWAMEEGMSELEWTQVSPNFVKWKAAVDELAGGEDEGSAKLTQYYATIARRRTEVGHHHVDD